MGPNPTICVMKTVWLIADTIWHFDSNLICFKTLIQTLHNFWVIFQTGGSGREGIAVWMIYSFFMRSMIWNLCLNDKYDQKKVAKNQIIIPSHNRLKSQLHWKSYQNISAKECERNGKRKKFNSYVSSKVLCHVIHLSGTVDKKIVISNQVFNY